MPRMTRNSDDAPRGGDGRRGDGRQRVGAASTPARGRHARANSLLVAVFLVLAGIAFTLHARAVDAQGHARAVIDTTTGTRKAAAPPAPLDVAAENARPGTPRWELRAHQVDGRTQAFADHSSVLPGTRIGLYVQCAAPAFTVRAVRTGYYAGTGGRVVWTSARTPCAQQPAAIVDTATGMARAPWTRTLSIATTGWPEGMYVLEVAATTGSATYVDLVVRSASTRGRVVLVSSTLTFQAYNEWGGRNAYRGRRGFADRARVVTFDRPQTWGQGSGKFLDYELPLVQRAERLGLPLAYLADTDVSAQPGILDGALSVVSAGHSEYWSQAQRDAFLAARDTGANLLFFGANTAYWRVRLSASPLGPDRVMTVYKVQAEDPDKAHPSIRFRDLGQPDTALTGVLYNCFPARGDFVVTDPTSWVFAGTGAHAGSRYAGLIGPEVDKVMGTPPGVTVLASSPTRCGRIRTHASMVLVRAASGAATVAVGTMGWVSEALRGRAPVDTVRFVTITTDNLLRASVRRGLG